MRDQSDREPLSGNVEGAPALGYDVWDWVDSDSSWRPLAPEECHWRYIGLRVLSLRQVLKYRDFGYLTERSPSRDRSDTLPLFPRVVATGQDQGHGMDAVPLP